MSALSATGPRGHLTATPINPDTPTEAGIQAYKIRARYAKAGPSILDRMIWEASRLAMPQHFATDLLKHDAARLASSDLPFAWYLYPSGTHMVNLIPEKHKKIGLYGFLEAIRENFSGGQWFTCDGKNVSSFRATDYQGARAFILGEVD